MKSASARVALLALALCSAPAPAQQPAPPAQHCPLSYGTTDAAKSHTLFLYFPAKQDATFGSDAGSGANPNWVPVGIFNADNLEPQLKGSTQALIDGVRTVVADDYCEFNVQVKTTTANPENGLPGGQPLPPRRAVIAIGGDTDKRGLWGESYNADLGDANDVDFSRVWAGRYITCAGGRDNGSTDTTNCPPPSSTELSGNNATVERWALAIGGSAAHEAGHTYGLEHANENPPNDPGVPPENGPTPIPGDGDYHQHIMPSGYFIRPQDRAEDRRFFGDVAFGILAANVGLSIQTMHNWDLVNPNQAAARSLEIDFLSPQTSVTPTWPYAGNRSPWLNPVVKQLPAPGPFKGVYYNAYSITWSAPNPAYNGGTGTVPGGGQFHIGTTFSGVDFNQPDPIIIQKITLRDARGNALALHPRLPMYDTGSVSTNGYSLNIYTPPGGGTPMQLQSARIYQLPRVAGIESMIGNGDPYTFDGRPITPWSSLACQPGSLLDGRHCPIAHLDDRPHVLVQHQVGDDNVIDCSRGALLRRLAGLLRERNIHLPLLKAEPLDGPKDSPEAPESREPEGPVCAGIQRDPFPSATVYLVATFVDPKARHWDPHLRRYVTGPVTSRLFYQFAGVRHPDQPWQPTLLHAAPQS